MHFIFKLQSSVTVHLLNVSLLDKFRIKVYLTFTHAYSCAK